MSTREVSHIITTILLAIIACSLLLLLGEKMGFVRFGKAPHAVTARGHEKEAHQHTTGCDEKEHGVKAHKPAHDHKDDHKDDHKAETSHGRKH